MSKVIFKMTFKHPNKGDTVSKNVSHIKYISTRSGVDKTVTEADLKKELEKGIEDINSDDETYVKYIDERPRSHGLFGKDGIEDPKDVQEEISHVDSFVWRGIISIKEEDAKELGFTKKEAWQDMLRTKVPDMAEKMGIRSTNLRWVAAVHMEQGHPHAHVVFWEKTPEKTVGIVKPKILDEIRKSYTDEIFAEQRLELVNEKNTMRDLIRDIGNDDISKASRLIREVNQAGEEIREILGTEEQEGLAPKLYPEEEKELIYKIQKLSEMLPGKGRIALKFMPENVKTEVRAIADELLQRQEFIGPVERNLKAVEQLTRLYTSNEAAIKNTQDQYSYIVNNVANRLENFGVNRDNIVDILKVWSENQFSDIKLSSDVKAELLSKIDFSGKFKSNNEKEVFDAVGIKLLEKIGGIDIEKIKESYLEQEINRTNISLKKMVDGGLLKPHDDNYFLTPKAEALCQIKENLNEVNRTILNCFSDKELSLDELMEDKRLYTLLKGNARANVFEVKKYDATIVKGYFGENNILNLNKFKASLEKKFQSEEKQNSEYKMVVSRIEKLVKNNIVEKLENDEFSFTKEGLESLDKIGKEFEYTSYDANVIYDYVNRAEGFLTESKLRKILSEDYKNEDEISKQYKYILGRLEKNVANDYAKRENINNVEGYSITQEGNDAREKILNPLSYNLKKYLNQLIERGLIERNVDNYMINEQFKYVLKNDLSSSENGIYNISEIKNNASEFIDKLISNMKDEDIEFKNLRKILKLKEVSDPIEKARDNAYNDIRDRLSQTILKGAAEAQRENIFYVDRDLSYNALEFIKNINSQINLIEDYKKVISEISTSLIRTGHDEEQILKYLSEFIDREELNLSKETLETIINEINESNIGINSDNALSFRKNVEHYLSVLKLSGYKEKEAFDILSDTIKNDSKKLEQTLWKLKEDGFLKKIGEQYKLTNKGVDEFLKIKELDRVEKEILKCLEPNGEEIEKVNFDNLIENKDIYDNLYNKDPEEFKLGRYDTKVREYFGEDNKLKFDKLEETIYGNYTDEEFNINMGKADVEIELLEKRIEKLVLNGYAKLDKESNTYSLTKECNNYFEYDDKKEIYVFTNEAIEKLGINKFEFTRYDANVSLSYIDKAEENVLTEVDLRQMLKGEIANKDAKEYYEKFTSMIESGQAKEYINISKDGDMTSTETGQELSRALSRLNKPFFACKGNIVEDKLKAFCDKEYGDESGEQFDYIIKQLENGVEKGYILKDEGALSYKIEPIFNDINKLLYQIYKENGTINKDDLREVLERNITNRALEKQLKYLTYRLDNLKKEGYLDGEENEYILNNNGLEKRKDILEPQRELLRGKIEYLERLGFLKSSGEEYQLTDKYHSYMKNVAISKEDKIPRTSEVMPKDIANIIDRTQDKVNVGKIERSNERIAMGKYINNEYKNIQSGYEDMRKYCNIPDTVEKTLKNLSKALLVSGMNFEETKEILHQWNLKSNSNIEAEKIDSIVKGSYETVKENDLWGDITVISKKDWNEMFKSLGIEEDDVPKWIYKGENWKSFNTHGIGLASIINDVWKSAWRQIEMDRMRTESQVEQMKKHLLKQQSSLSRSAIVEEVRKNKDKNHMHDEFER